MYVSIAAITMSVQELLDRVVFSCTSIGSLVAWNSSRLPDMDPYKTKKTQNTSSSLFPTIFYQGGGVPSSSHRSHGLVGSVFSTTEVLHMRVLWPAYGGRGGEIPMNNTPQICYFKLGWRSRELEETYKTRSQIASWTLMLTALLILFVSMSIRQCILRRKHFSLPNIECCYQVKANEALKKCHAKAKEMAKEETNRKIWKLLHNVEKRPDAVTCLKEVAIEVKRK